MDVLTAARQVAERVGLDAREAVVLRELRTSVVHLRPSHVVARVAPLSEGSVVRRELAVAAYLADHQAPVAAPWRDPGPHEVGDLVVTLWTFVDHDADRPVDGAEAGRRLRTIHDVLAGYDAGDLPRFPRLDEVRAIVPTLEVTPADADGLAEMLALAVPAAAALDVPVQAVHGDAWLGNVLSTSEGPVWTDFELACVGPRELDLACNETSTQGRSRRPADDDFLAGYGPHDADVLQRAAALEMVPLTAWTYQLAATRPEYLDKARSRLTWAIERLRG